ncbi:uncharacterized protein YER152C [Nematostella vectensis]|uniref:uncharacterized protein YER152C n=1 Tax=Nematostella vectensis TaxID=45351 RepID=UPI00207792FA|nr:uncharacterized protein YER152C [Nematostella vectensis]
MANTKTLFDWAEKGGIVSLGIGAPDKTLLAQCSELMMMASQHLVATGETSFLQYGPRLGDIDALKALASFLSKEYKAPVDVKNLMFNSGASQGLKFLAGSLMQHGDTVFVEDPTYFIAINVLVKDQGMNVVPVTTDEGGIDVEQLDQLMSKYASICSRPLTDKKPFRFMVYLTPTFNNPRGTDLTKERSVKLVQVLRKHKALAICDDVYNVIYFKEDNLPNGRLFSYDNKIDPNYQGNVISNASFSKILGPGLRLGWIEGPTHLLTMLSESGYSCSGGCFNHYTGCIIGKAIELGLVSKHLEHSRKVYHSRMTALCDAIDEYLPKVRYFRPSGGYFVWLEFPENIDTQELLNVSKREYSVFFHVGPKCSCVGNFRNCARFSAAFYSEDILKESIRKISLALSKLMKE